MEAYLKTDSETLPEGYHGLHVHSKAVRKNDCSEDKTGGHFNPEGKGGRYLDRLRSVRAGERGEVNTVNTITIDLTADGVTAVGTIEPVMYCPPEPYMLFPDGRVERITNLKKAEKKRNKKVMKGKLSPYTIVYKTPDCYQPVWNRNSLTYPAAPFVLEGDKSIVGRAVVLQDVDGNSDPGIACCTLKIVSDEA